MNKTTLQESFNKTLKFIKNLDWKNPRIIFSAISLAIIPFVARHYFFTGLLLGLLLAIAVLWLLEKSPQFVKDLCVEYPLASDIVLSSFAVMTVGGYFGSGLMLGFAAVVCAIAMSVAIAMYKDALQAKVL